MSNKKTYLMIIILVLSGLSVSAQEFVRKIEQHTFVPKGQWIAGTSVSFSEYSGENYKFLVVEGLNTDGYTFKVSPMVAYAFKDNIAGGGRFMYNRNLTKINSVDITINEDTGFNVENMYSLSHNWGGTFFLRNYISLNNNRRFGLYNEIQVTMQKGRSKIINGEGDDLTGTFEKSTEVGIGLSPGLVAFVNNYMAVEVGVGVLGLNFNKVRQVTDQVYVGERSYNKANFKINLFAISLGLVFYL